MRFVFLFLVSALCFGVPGSRARASDESSCVGSCRVECMKQVVPSRAHGYLEIASDAARLYNVPLELMIAVMRTESNYYASAVSNKGAIGLMQIMPSTGEFLKIENVRDPRQNIFGAAKLIRMLANQSELDMILVIAAYHAGLGAVRKYGGVPNFKSTKKYVRAVAKRYFEFRAHLNSCGQSFAR